MGLEENVIPELKSGEIENFRTSEILVQAPNCEPPDPVSYGMISEMVITEPVEQKIVCGAQNVENIPLSLEESCNEKGQSLEKGETKLEHANVVFVSEKIIMPLENISTNDGKMDILTEESSLNPDCGKLEQMQTSAAVESDHLKNKDNRTNSISRNSKNELKSAVISSRVRTEFQDKPKALETDDTFKNGSSNVEKRKRERKRKRAKTGSVNEFSRTRTHLKYLLHRIKYEQSLIDAYSAEGWKGQSVEKLKPEKELQRARSHILREKLRIRDLFKNLDLSLAVGQLPESLFDSLGEIGSEDIFCAKCGSKDLSLENDIILCDGACERGFHQYCLEPPLLKSQIPPDDEGWLCPGCDCKVDCIDILKDFQGANVSITDSWEKIFPEAVSVGKRTEDGSRSCEDDDFVERAQGDESSSEKSNYFSASDNLAAAANDDKYLELPSDDSADNDFDPSASDQDKQVPDQDEQVTLSSSSSDFTSDSEDLDALLDDASMPSIDLGHVSPSPNRKFHSIGSDEECPEDSRMKNRSLKAELAYLMKTGDEPVTGKRLVQLNNCRKLLEETYGDTSDSSDEDFDKTAAHKRKKSNLGKTVAVFSDKSRTMENKTDSKDENRKGGNCSPRGMPNSVADGKAVESSADDVLPSAGSKRKIIKRLGEAATQKLYESFNKNRLPSRAVKENLAKELGLEVQQVSKWFENARWSFKHRSKMESNTSIEPQKSQISNVEGNADSNLGLEQIESTVVPAQSQTPETRVEILVSDSGVVKPRERKGGKDRNPARK